jgi:hypothetical protein
MLEVRVPWINREGRAFKVDINAVEAVFADNLRDRRDIHRHAFRVSEREVLATRRCTYTGRPLGTAEFIGGLEKKMLRRLGLLKGGRPGKPTTDSRQSE